MAEVSSACETGFCSFPPENWGVDKVSKSAIFDGECIFVFFPTSRFDWKTFSMKILLVHCLYSEPVTMFDKIILPRQFHAGSPGTGGEGGIDGRDGYPGKKKK